MAIREVVKLGHDVLRMQAKPVEIFDASLHVLLEDMKETMYKENGVGLAANQVGLALQVAVVDIGEGCIEFVNPKIMVAKGDQVGMEGCLSVNSTSGYVHRPKKITVVAQDRFGNTFRLKAQNFLAVAICHEVDHLQGIVFVDKIDHAYQPKNED